MIYKEYKDKSTFYPGLGIFFNEFALFYAVQAAIKQKHSEQKTT